MTKKDKIKELLNLGKTQVEIAKITNSSQAYVSLVATGKASYTMRKMAAKKSGINFTIKFEDLEFPEYCPLLGIKIDYESKHGKGAFDNYPSLDRINPNLGYTKENTWIISARANRIKNDSSLEELELLYTNLKKYKDTKEEYDNLSYLVTILGS